MFYKIRTIVAGIVTPQDDPVLLPALEIAARCNAFLHLVHAPEIPDLRWSPTPPHDDSSYRSPSCVDEVFHMGRRDRVDYHAVSGPPAAAILSTAREVNADLVIVGATRRRPIAGRLFGTTARRLIRDGSAPVLVLRGAAPLHVSRVLLPTDLSADSATVHEIGLDLVESLFPADPPEIRELQVVFDDPSLAPPLRPLIHQLGQEQLAEFLGARRARPFPIQPRTRYGDPVQEIVEEAEEWGSELIVLGSHGRTGVARVLLGSTTEGVLSRAHSSLLVVPRRAAESMILPAPIVRHEFATVPT